MYKYLCVAGLVVFQSVILASASVVFDLRDRDFTDPHGKSIEDLDEATTFALIRSGITAYVSAYVDGSLSGVLNQTQAGFGINALLPGDTTDEIDATQGQESALVTFDQDLFLKSLHASSLGEDHAMVKIGNLPPLLVDSSGFQSPEGILLGVGEPLEILHFEGNGFSIDSFEVALIPEPASAALMLVGMGMLVMATRNRYSPGNIR